MAFPDKRETGANLDRAPTAADRPAWFPDWSGQSCAIVATGPSASKANIKLLKGRVKVVAIKEAAVDLCPWADAVYGCDAAWWKYRRGLPDFKGLKIAWDGTVRTQFPDVNLIRIKPHRPNVPGERWMSRILVDEPGVIGSGDNSAFQAGNMVVQFGARRIMFVGLDLQGTHYYGRNDWPRAGNPDPDVFKKCIRAFEDAAPTLEAMGIDVVNASPVSALNCFRKMTIEQVVAAWSL